MNAHPVSRDTWQSGRNAEQAAESPVITIIFVPGYALSESLVEKDVLTVVPG